MKPSKEGLGKRKRADEEDQLQPLSKKQATSDMRSRKTTRGLKNHGNMCFFNAAIQVMANCDPLADQLVSSFERASDKQQEIALSHDDLCAASGRASSRAMKALKKRLDKAYSEIGADNISLSAELGRLVGMMRDDEERSSTSPLQLAVAYAQLYGEGFDGDSQQDAVEFLHQATRRIVEEADQSPELANVQELFTGHWAVIVQHSPTPSCRPC